MNPVFLPLYACAVTRMRPKFEGHCYYKFGMMAREAELKLSSLMESEKSMSLSPESDSTC